MNDISMSFREVPPPKVAPLDTTAESLGLARGLKAEKSDHQYRCANCRRMQKNGSWLVWVSDSVRITDPLWSITETERTNAFNGCGSGWCLSCARKLVRPLYDSPILFWAFVAAVVVVAINVAAYS